MNIATYYEGGIGDVLLGHKLAWILKQTIYPNSNFIAFCDSENNPLQASVLKYLFPSFYKEIYTIPNKKYKKLVINSQFGEEEVRGFYNNVSDDWKNKIESYDKWYNFHIDSLEYLNYPELQWVKFLKQFPCPETLVKSNLDPYICSNIYSETGTEHLITESWWADRLILGLDELAKNLNYQHIIISTPKLNNKYKDVLEKSCRTNLLNTNVEQVCDVIGNSRGFVGIDSAWRLISHFYNKPTITISKNCFSRGNCPVSHRLRWLPFPETTFNLYSPTNEIIKLAEKMIENQIYQGFPELAYLELPLDQVIIKRNYKINLEKSILNEK